MVFGLLAHNGFAKAPTISPIGETLQIQDNTLIGFKIPPTSVERGWLAQYVDLAMIDANNRVLAYKGVNTALETILYKLANQENGLRNTCKLDVNEKLSCGLFHFQQQTYEYECNAYDFGEDMDKPTQVKCAIKMIMEGKGHTYGGWYNSWNKLNLPII